jgi:hypothetical protein
MDMRRLAVSIASNIETIDQWKSFCENGGGILPLLECIRDGAREGRQGQILTQGNDYDQGMLGLVEQREAALEAACKACKALRDLCVISKPFSAVITDSILRADVMWATKVDSKTEKNRLRRGGILSDLAFLIKYSMDSDKLYNPPSEWEEMSSARSNGIHIISNRRQRKLARQRCALYVIQLLLAMSFASDKAVDRLRATMGLTEIVLACSSYAKKEHLIQDRLITTNCNTNNDMMIIIYLSPYKIITSMNLLSFQLFMDDSWIFDWFSIFLLYIRYLTNILNDAQILHMGVF